MTLEEKLKRAEELAGTLGDVPDYDELIARLDEIATLAKEIHQEVERLKREADAAG